MKTARMHLIGYWIESLEDPHYVPPQELVTDWEPGLQQQVAGYLDAGEEFRRYRSASWCRFYCGHAMGGLERTDGQWAWPSDLSHYVRDHSVSLPREFIEHVRSSPPPPVKSLAWYAGKPDPTLWREWSRTSASGALRATLETARCRADDRADRLLHAAAAEVERETGLSPENCQTGNCRNLAVAGRPFCSRCLVERDRHLHVGHLYTDLRPILAPG